MIKDKGQRELKVYENSGSGVRCPRISLQGRWLEDYGFQIGNGITVTCENGILTIRKMPG